MPSVSAKSHGCEKRRNARKAPEIVRFRGLGSAVTWTKKSAPTRGRSTRILAPASMPSLAAASPAGGALRQACEPNRVASHATRFEAAVTWTKKSAPTRGRSTRILASASMPCLAAASRAGGALRLACEPSRVASHATGFEAAVTWTKKSAPTRGADFFGCGTRIRT